MADILLSFDFLRLILSQISNGTKIHNSKYTYLLKIKSYEEKLKWLLAKRDNFPNFGNFKKVFGFFCDFD